MKLRADSKLFYCLFKSEKEPDFNQALFAVLEQKLHEIQNPKPDKIPEMMVKVCIPKMKSFQIRDIREFVIRLIERRN